MAQSAWLTLVKQEFAAGKKRDKNFKFADALKAAKKKYKKNKFIIYMSLDLTKFDVYNYDLYLRPDGQTTTPAAGAGLIPTAVGSGKLKQQFLNIPNGFNFNPSNKVYLYLKDVRFGAKDAVDFVNGNFDQKYYIKVKTSSQYQYTNFSGSDTVLKDSDAQECQPYSALIPIDLDPVVQDRSNIPMLSDLASHLDTNLTTTQFGKIHLIDTVDFTHKATIEAGTSTLAAPLDYDAAVAHSTSYVELDVEVEHVVTAGGSTEVVNLTNGKELVGLTLNKNTNMMDRMVCIGNPFGNAIEFQVVAQDLGFDYPDPLDGFTQYDAFAAEDELTNAVLISFSILVEKENKY